MALRRLLQGSVLPRVTGRALAPAVAPFSTESGETIRATLFPGDGIGPEIAESVKQVQNLGSAWFLCTIIWIVYMYVYQKVRLFDRQTKAMFEAKLVGTSLSMACRMVYCFLMPILIERSMFHFFCLT